MFAKERTAMVIFIILPDPLKFSKNTSFEEFPDDYVREKGAHAADSDYRPDIAPEFAEMEKTGRSQRCRKGERPKKAGGKSSQVIELPDPFERLKNAGPRQNDDRNNRENEKNDIRIFNLWHFL